MAYRKIVFFEIIHVEPLQQGIDVRGLGQSKQPSRSIPINFHLKDIECFSQVLQGEL